MAKEKDTEQNDKMKALQAAMAKIEKDFGKGASCAWATNK